MDSKKMASEKQASLKRSTLINAPLEKVFAYYSNPENNPEIWPSLIEVKDVERSPEGHPKTWNWVYKMAGMRFNGSAEMTEYLPNKRTVTQSKGGISSTNVITYEKANGGARVTDEVSYHIPIPLLGQIAERVLLRMNENELATIHANLKAKMESY